MNAVHWQRTRRTLAELPRQNGNGRNTQVPSVQSRHCTKGIHSRSTFLTPSTSMKDIEMKYRKKPVVIDAVQWTGNNLKDVAALGGAREYGQDFIGDNLIINTLEGDMTANVGDWIIKGVKGELYPCKPD